MRTTELEALYRDRLPQFRRVAAAILGDREAACDAVQDAFAQALRRRRTYRGDGPLEAWVWRIVLNTARSERRSSRTREQVAPGAHPTTNGGPPPGDLPLHLLSDRQREVLFLRYYADLDYRSIATALGISPGTVAATLSAAHATLRAALEEAPR